MPSSTPLPINSQSEFISIFRTHAWISSWIAAWENYLQQQKFAYNNDFYVIPMPVSGFSIATAIPVGCNSRTLGSIRAEYFQADLQHWSEQLCDIDWQQLIIPDVDLQADFYTQLKKYLNPKNYSLLTRSVAIAYGIKTTGDFSEYLSRLSQSARARLFNKRKKLVQIGKLKIENRWPDLDGFVGLLNKFHQLRWGKPCYQDENLSFLKIFINRLLEQGGQVNLSVMTLDGEAVSALLDLEYQGRVYNLQAGFVEKIANNIALGSLHLGYEIEAAFVNPSIQYYDFMAGQGKNTDYKAAFATHTQNLATLYIIKPKWLYWLYKINDWFKR